MSLTFWNVTIVIFSLLIIRQLPALTLVYSSIGSIVMAVALYTWASLTVVPEGHFILIRSITGGVRVALAGVNFVPFMFERMLGVKFSANAADDTSTTCVPLMSTFRATPFVVTTQDHVEVELIVLGKLDIKAHADLHTIDNVNQHLCSEIRNVFRNLYKTTNYTDDFNIKSATSQLNKITIDSGFGWVSLTIYDIKPTPVGAARLAGIEDVRSRADSEMERMRVQRQAISANKEICTATHVLNAQADVIRIKALLEAGLDTEQVTRILCAVHSGSKRTN